MLWTPPPGNRSTSVAERPPQATDQGNDLFLQIVTAMAQAVELRDKYTGGHTQRVTNYALLLADQLELPLEQKRHLQIGTPLHDIGKIGVDDAILRKNGRLTAEEYEAMKAHTVQGSEILETIPELKPILPIVRNHHERWNGAGYPDGLAGEQIPLLARIVASPTPSTRWSPTGLTGRAFHRTGIRRVNGQIGDRFRSAVRSGISARESSWKIWCASSERWYRPKNTLSVR